MSVKTILICTAEHWPFYRTALAAFQDSHPTLIRTLNLIITLILTLFSPPQSFPHYHTLMISPPLPLPNDRTESQLRSLSHSTELASLGKSCT